MFFATNFLSLGVAVLTGRPLRGRSSRVLQFTMNSFTVSLQKTGDLETELHSCRELKLQLCPDLEVTSNCQRIVKNGRSRGKDLSIVMMK